MPVTYKPQDRGYRIQYTIYFPDGTKKTKTKERKTKILIDELYRKAENLEIGGRRQDLTRREIISALHESLLTSKEAQKLSGGETLAVYDFDKIMKHEVVLRAGLDPSLTLHHTRHTYGSTLLQLTGGNLRYVQEKMRHADINTTKQYMHTILSGNAPEMVLNYGEE